MSHMHWESHDARKAHTSCHQQLIMWWIKGILDGLGLFTPGLHHNHCLSWILTLAPTLYCNAVSLFQCFHNNLWQLQWIVFTLQGIRWSPQADFCSCPWGVDHRGASPNWKADQQNAWGANKLQRNWSTTDQFSLQSDRHIWRLTAALMKAGISLIPAKRRLIKETHVQRDWHRKGWWITGGLQLSAAEEQEWFSDNLKICYNIFW